MEVQFHHNDVPSDLVPDFKAIFHDEGDYYLQELKGIDARVCAGCGTKTSLCPTWGVCDWETVPTDDLEEHIEEMAEDRGCTVVRN